MNLLDGTVLQDVYDVIVVGAGMGGMTAASLLAKRGLSVLMIEQQNKPGGACTSFKREDHVFDVGAAMLYGFGEKGFRPFRFLLNELEEPIDVVAHKTLARMTFEGHEIIFWPDIDRFLEELYLLFPKEKDNLRAFYDDLYKKYENIVIKNEVISPPSEFSPRQGLRRLLSDPLTIIKMQKLLSTSTKDLMQKYFRSPDIVDFFDKLCSAYSYTTAEETPAVLAATMFIDNHIGGVYFPAGGAQMFPNVIEKAFERDGGQVLYQQLVDEILIRDGQAYGVRLQNGIEIRAERVIANATVWNIYGKLIRPEHIAPERLKWAKALIPTFPSMTLYLVVMAISPNMCTWPRPDDPGYRSEDYEAQKQREAEKMLDQIEMHIPGFRQQIRELIIGTPSTIERVLLKNGGAVGGPKNQIGQEMLNRLHARSEWKRLYFCGDSTVMGTGQPATAVSVVGAANVILRELHLPDYDVRKFPKQYVNFVDQPYTRPAFDSSEEISEKNAYLAAAQCQGCLEPQCVVDCPAGIDIPGFMRRMEAKNYAGAARLIREKNPFGEVCGWTCSAGQLCQRACYRRDFTGKPVRIAELQRWVCAAAGEKGWLKLNLPPSGSKVAVIGGGPSALSCAYYLSLAGCRVTVFGEEERPGGMLWKKATTGPALQPSIQRDIEGLLSSGITYKVRPGEKLDLAVIQNKYRAVYLTEAGAESRPGIFVGEEYVENGVSVVAAAAHGRKAAMQIWQYLNSEMS